MGSNQRPKGRCGTQPLLEGVHERQAAAQEQWQESPEAAKLGDQGGTSSYHGSKIL